MGKRDQLSKLSNTVNVHLLETAIPNTPGPSTLTHTPQECNPLQLFPLPPEPSAPHPHPPPHLPTHLCPPVSPHTHSGHLNPYPNSHTQSTCIY